MKHHIKNLLQELYEIDPALAAHEAEIQKVIEQFVALQPGAEMDAKAKKALRQKLLETFTASAPKKSNIFMFMNHMLSLKITSAAFVVVLAVAGVVYLASEKQSSYTMQETIFLGETRIAAVDKAAFGPLRTDAPAEAGGFGAAEFATGLGGGGNYAARPQSGGGGDMMIMPAYTPFRYEFTYVGDEIVLPDEQVQIYKRVVTSDGISSLQRFVQQFEVGLVDLDSFDNLKMQSVSVYEDKEFGHTIHLDIEGAMVSLSEYWQGWMMPERTCSTADCYDRYALTAADVPEDEELIAIATAFLKEHGIAVDSYGEPQVLDAWRTYYAEAVARGDQIYIPDVMSVVFPEKINDTIVYDEGGSPSGMMVSVNTRHKKVSGAWNIAAREYQSSPYAAVTSANEITTYIEQGAQYQYYDQGIDAAVVALNVLTPEVRLVKMYQYKDGVTTELYVPSLIFPVTKAYNESALPYVYPPEQLIVPLEKELFEQRIMQQQNIAIPYAEPMALPEIDVVESLPIGL